ncbi:hypothetical protein CYMTET_13412 [Cymbomonas tetramitiformis]|uniref:Uncharacterized protein n=1 Tax=Cymbomonas tetramitiformis TaxID=36881 RepID=A0AAE0GI72_9CHLO|nr:hypothetical protein CYMTET_13412 [Cymbomonas tetramitiformis]
MGPPRFPSGAATEAVLIQSFLQLSSVTPCNTEDIATENLFFLRKISTSNFQTSALRCTDHCKHYTFPNDLPVKFQERGFPHLLVSNHQSRARIAGRIRNCCSTTRSNEALALEGVTRQDAG